MRINYLEVYKIIKYVFDRFFSLFILLLLMPALILISFILFIIDDGQILFFQYRIGQYNKEFKILKFKTMIKNSMNIGYGATTIKNDPRITKFGKILRKTKINELPQIINIIMGDMSIVGPRPLPKNSFMKYPEFLRDNLYLNKPGLTGIASLVFRDEEDIISDAINNGENHIEFYKNHIYPYKSKLELWYIENISFKTDFYIIWLTAYKVLFPKSKIIWKIFKDLPKLKL